MRIKPLKKSTKTDMNSYRKNIRSSIIDSKETFQDKLLKVILAEKSGKEQNRYTDK
jgi:hypothetical protein